MKLQLVYNSDASVLPNDDVTVKGLDINVIYNQN